MSIAKVIARKFNNQEGMRTNADGEIIAFPGGIPSQQDQDLWTAEYEAWKIIQDNNIPIYVQIDTLEKSTLRSLRDSARGNGNTPGQDGVTPRERLDDIEAQIEILRGQLL